MSDPIEDFEIVLDVLAGNRNAFTELVRRYEQRVRGYCISMLGEYTAGEDAAQEIFVKVYQALASFRGNSSFSTWVYRITNNHCTDILRKRSRQRTESWEALVENEGERIEALIATPPNESFSEETKELVNRVLDQLSEKSKTVLILREIHELSYEEIASTMNCSLDAVKGRLKRARQELEEKWQHILGAKASKA